MGDESGLGGSSNISRHSGRFEQALIPTEVRGGGKLEDPSGSGQRKLLWLTMETMLRGANTRSTKRVANGDWAFEITQ